MAFCGGGGGGGGLAGRDDLFLWDKRVHMWQQCSGDKHLCFIFSKAYVFPKRTLG